MNSMFRECKSLVSLDLTNLDTSMVTDMSSMFSDCGSLTDLKLGFNTEKVRNMGNMFASCIELKELNIGTFNTRFCNNFENMFDNCNGLDLYLNIKNCENLIDEIPDFVTYHNIEENQ